MSQLTALHQRLAMFRSRRQWLRWGMAWSAMGIGVLATLAAIFALDYRFELTVSQRGAVILLGLIPIFWTAIRFARPWLGIHETETDVALFVQSQHGIDSDLVAALQFDRSAQENWGSPALQSVVVARVATLSPQLDLERGVDYRPVTHRFQLLAAMILFTLVISAIVPGHIATFTSRLFLLSNRHYPSRTKISDVEVNGIQVWGVAEGSMRPRDSRCAKNRPVTFLVCCTGELPERGGIVCRSHLHGTVRTLEMTRLAAEEVAKRLRSRTVSKDDSAYYVAELPRLVEEFSYSLRLGDAWTDSAAVQMIVPPLVDLQVQVTPPAYAAHATAPEQSPRYLAVLEGSRIELELRSIGAGAPDKASGRSEQGARSRRELPSKPLQAATVTVNTNGELSKFAMVNVRGDGRTWVLPDRTPFARIQHELQYQIQVVDRDGMALESPLQGTVQLKVDRPPAAIASAIHRVVLPTARPIIDFRLSDDYGIASAHLSGEIGRATPLVPNLQADPSSPAENQFLVNLPLGEPPIVGIQLPIRGEFSLDLAPYGLAKGDRLTVTLVAIDDRGAAPGEEAMSEPIVLEISDEAGVLAAITEADERSEKRLDEVIQQQLKVGGSR